MPDLLAVPAAAALALGLLVAGSRLVAPALCPGQGPAYRGAARLAGAHALAVLLFQVLAPARSFALAPVLLCLASMVLAGRARDGRLFPADLAEDLASLAHRLREAAAGPWGGPIVAASALLAVAALRALLAPPLAWDALTYHLVIAGLVVQGRLPSDLPAPGSWSYYREFPWGAEAYSAFALLPANGDLLVGLTSFPAWLWLVTSAVALASAAGSGIPLAIGLAVGFLPTVSSHLTIAYADLPALAAGVFAAACLVPRDPPGATGREPLLAGLALGILAVSKPTGPAVALVAGLPLLTRPPRVVAGALAAFVLVAAPDLARSLWVGGSPIHPVPVEFGGRRPAAGHAAFRESLAAANARAGEVYPTLGSELPVWGSLCLPRLGVPGPLLPVAAFAGLLGLGSLVRRRAWTLLAVLGAGVAAWLVPYLMPAGRGYRLLWPELNSRHLVVPIALGLAAGGDRIGPGLLRGLTVLGLWVAGFTWWPGPMRPLGAGPVAVLVAAFGVARWSSSAPGARPAPGPGARRGLGWVLGGALAAFLAVPWLSSLRQQDRELRWRTWQELKPLPEGLAGMFAGLDGEPVTVAVTAGLEKDGQHWFWFPCFGSRLRNRVVYVPVAEGYRGEFEPVPPGTIADRGVWLAGLRRAGVTRLAILPGETPEAGWVRELPEVFSEVPGSGGRLFVVTLPR